MKARYRKAPKFSDTRKLCCKLPKIQEKRPSFRVFRQKDANGIANNEDRVQTAPLGAGEHGGLVVKASDSGSRGQGFKPHSGQTVLCP